MLLVHEVVARKTQFAMGTIMVHEAFGRYAQESVEAVCAEVERLENLFSRFRPESEINRINYAAGKGQQMVSSEIIEVLSRAVQFSHSCPGYLDITICPLVDVWKIGRNAQAFPDETAIIEKLPLVNFRDVILNPEKQTASLRKAGQSIDLGGIGKGYTADMILDVYKTFGIRSAYSNLGGNVVTLGTKPDGSSWKIGIQHPRMEDRLIGVVTSAGQSVVTSGDYQRYITGADGKRYHHILDPRTGYPSESGLLSVTIVSGNSITADALSTMVFIAGMEKGIAVLSKYPQVEAVLVDADCQVFITRGLKDRFQADTDIHWNILN